MVRLTWYNTRSWHQVQDLDLFETQLEVSWVHIVLLRRAYMYAIHRRWRPEFSQFLVLGFLMRAAVDSPFSAARRMERLSSDRIRDLMSH